tara:strand:- start:1418 stop:1696 length:279 start_codon:yes stop_codon:yes gene_type:complete
MTETRKQKISRVKKEIRNYNFNIPIETLPDIPEDFNIEIMTFVCYHMETLCKSDAKEFMSYLMFVLSEKEYEDLLFNLWSLGVNINECSPTC